MCVDVLTCPSRCEHSGYGRAGMPSHPTGQNLVDPTSGNNAVTGIEASGTASLTSGELSQSQSSEQQPTSANSSRTENGTSPITTSANKLAMSTTMSSNNNNNNSASSTNVKSCAGCGARIIDRFLLHAMDRYWHTGCLKCSCCQAQLGEIGTSCFTKAGMILCKNDYIRLFGSSGTCAACAQNIPAQEFVMRAQGNVYHVNCFTCVTCHQRLVPGDRYSIVNGSLICEQDYPKVLKGHSTIPMRASHKVC